MFSYIVPNVSNNVRSRKIHKFDLQETFRERERREVGESDET